MSFCPNCRKQLPPNVRLCDKCGMPATRAARYLAAKEVQKEIIKASARREEGKLDEAFAIFQLLAQKGDSNAQVCLGAMYFDGEGVEKDFAEAFEWFRKAAEQECDEAQKALDRLNVRQH